MNSLSILRRSGIAALLLVLATRARAEQPSEAEAWLNNYYQNPAPERLPSAILELSNSGYFEVPGHVPLAIGFIASVFAQNPDRVEDWMGVSRALPVAHQRILASALWYSGNAKGPAYLRRLSRNADPEVRHEVEALAATTPDLRAVDVRSAQSLNLQWGAFLASGDKTPVRNILAALGSQSNSKLSQEVRWSLAQNAAQHQRVLAICRDELSRQPNEVRETLRAVINDTEARRQPST
jgi:hypothetical protein